MPLFVDAMRRLNLGYSEFCVENAGNLLFILGNLLFVLWEFK